ncbi:MAG: helix-turn-helix transcriptional regulator [Verrucomicrobia bacterium]|nr:helix-turn-helix transcriptional regulator [Verrucomicrobiota bacterium]
MDVVANRAGTTKRTLYAHFASKEDLFLAVFHFLKGFS